MTGPKTLLIALLPALSLTACYSDNASFAERYAKLSCQELAECHRYQFVDRYNGDLDRCRADIEDWLLEISDSCEYIPAEGRECLQEMKQERYLCDPDEDRRECDPEEVYDDCPLSDIFGAFDREEDPKALIDLYLLSTEP